MLVYYHGGGWVIADLDTYDDSARALTVKNAASLKGDTAKIAIAGESAGGGLAAFVTPSNRSDGR